jgi:hypothetical protein
MWPDFLNWIGWNPYELFMNFGTTFSAKVREKPSAVQGNMMAAGVWGGGGKNSVWTQEYDGEGGSGIT